MSEVMTEEKAAPQATVQAAPQATGQAVPQGTAYQPFCGSFRVYYEDTDAGGIVYHANYLKFCERVRSDFVREVVGFSQRDALQGAQGFVMTKFNGKFIAPAYLEDLLTVSCIPCQVTRARIEIYQEIKRADGKLLYAQRCTLAYIDFERNAPLAVPPEFKDAFGRYLAPEDQVFAC